jgi:CubicO group peptidase (beta-lactamase class C family)
MSDDGTTATRATIDESDLEATCRQIADRHPVVGLAAGVVTTGRPAAFAVHGVADPTTGSPITPDTVFRIASITKTFTAVAVMQLWERSLVELDAPAGEYLRAYRLVPARPDHPPATVRQLLTHTAGLPELARPRGVVMKDFGESVPDGRPVPSLAEFYGGELRLRAAPGTRFVYGNHGPASLGQLVEDVTGDTLARYLRDHVFEPLGMDDTDLGRTERTASRLAAGHEIGSRGVAAIPFRAMVTAGAASICSTPRDMARYLSALLAGGTGARRSILRPETIAMMFDPHYRPDPRIPGMGLAFFRGRAGAIDVVGHQGTLPGFHSQVFLAPAAGLAVMAFTNGGHQPDFWIPAETSRLLAEAAGVADEAADGPVPHRPGDWAELSGWYRLDAGLADVRLRAMMGAGVEVFVRGGRPMLRFLTPIPALAGGFPLEPGDVADRDVYDLALPGDGLTRIRVAFGRNDNGGVDRIHLDLMPLTLPKQPAATNPRRWAAASLGVAAATTALRRRRRTS